MLSRRVTWHNLSLSLRVRASIPSEQLLQPDDMSPYAQLAYAMSFWQPVQMLVHGLGTCISIAITMPAVPSPLHPVMCVQLQMLSAFGGRFLPLCTGMLQNGQHEGSAPGFPKDWVSGHNQQRS